jgi:hypothetical protein
VFESPVHRTKKRPWTEPNWTDGNRTFGHGCHMVVTHAVHSPSTIQYINRPGENRFATGLQLNFGCSALEKYRNMHYRNTYYSSSTCNMYVCGTKYKELKCATSNHDK